MAIKAVGNPRRPATTRPSIAKLGALLASVALEMRWLGPRRKRPMPRANRPPGCARRDRASHNRCEGGRDSAQRCQRRHVGFPLFRVKRFHSAARETEFCMRLICASNRSTQQIMPIGRMSSRAQSPPPRRGQGTFGCLASIGSIAAMRLIPRLMNSSWRTKRRARRSRTRPTTLKSTATYAAAALSSIASSAWPPAK